MQTWEAIRSRRDVRSFEDRAVPTDHLNEILEAGRRAPSARNRQPWDFVVVTDPETRRAFHAHVQVERDSFAATLEGERAGTFAGIKIDGVTEASLSVVVTYDPDRGSPSVVP